MKLWLAIKTVWRIAFGTYEKLQILKANAADASEERAYNLALNEIDDRKDARKHVTEVRKLTAGFWEMRLLTFLIAFPFVEHLWAVWLDTRFKLGWKIDKFPEPFNEMQMNILLSFFGLTAASIGLRGIAAAIAYFKRK